VFASSIIAIIAYSRAKSSAIEWGDLVKSSFDLFLSDLCKKLGFSIPVTGEEQQILWEKFSQAIIYVNPEHMPSHDKLSSVENA